MDEVTLVNLGDGAAVEMFGYELVRVLRNIRDPNTDAEAVREIKLTVAIKPDQQREMGKYSIKVSSKLAACQPHGSQLFIGETESGRFVACEANPLQMDLFKDPEPERNEKVAPIRGAKEGNVD